MTAWRGGVVNQNVFVMIRFLLSLPGSMFFVQ